MFRTVCPSRFSRTVPLPLNNPSERRARPGRGIFNRKSAFWGGERKKLQGFLRQNVQRRDSFFGTCHN